jgi:hypothetical protein
LTHEFPGRANKIATDSQGNIWADTSTRTDPEHGRPFPQKILEKFDADGHPLASTTICDGQEPCLVHELLVDSRDSPVILLRRGAPGTAPLQAIRHLGNNSLLAGNISPLLFPSFEHASNTSFVPSSTIIDNSRALTILVAGRTGSVTGEHGLWLTRQDPWAIGPRRWSLQLPVQLGSDAATAHTPYGLHLNADDSLSFFAITPAGVVLQKATSDGQLLDPYFLLSEEQDEFSSIGFGSFDPQGNLWLWGKETGRPTIRIYNTHGQLTNSRALHGIGPDFGLVLNAIAMDSDSNIAIAHEGLLSKYDSHLRLMWTRAITSLSNTPQLQSININYIHFDDFGNIILAGTGQDPDRVVHWLRKIYQ